MKVRENQVEGFGKYFHCSDRAWHGSPGLVWNAELTYYWGQKLQYTQVQSR